MDNLIQTLAIAAIGVEGITFLERCALMLMSASDNSAYQNVLQSTLFLQFKLKCAGKSVQELVEMLSSKAFSTLFETDSVRQALDAEYVDNLLGDVHNQNMARKDRIKLAIGKLISKGLDVIGSFESVQIDMQKVRDSIATVVELIYQEAVTDPEKVTDYSELTHQIATNTMTVVVAHMNDFKLFSTDRGTLMSKFTSAIKTMMMFFPDDDDDDDTPPASTKPGKRRRDDDNDNDNPKRPRGVTK